MTTYNFFVMCPEDGFEVFETIDGALDAADERIKGYLVDGWSEEVTNVCVGKITHRAKICDQVFPDGEIDEDGIDEAGEYWDPDFDCKCNYKMMPVETDLNSKLVMLTNLLWRARSSVDYQMGSQNQNTDAGKAHIEGFKGFLVEIDSAISEYRTQVGDL